VGCAELFAFVRGDLLVVDRMRVELGEGLEVVVG